MPGLVHERLKHPLVMQSHSLDSFLAEKLGAVFDTCHQSCIRVDQVVGKIEARCAFLYMDGIIGQQRHVSSRAAEELKRYLKQRIPTQTALRLQLFNHVLEGDV